MMSVIEGTIAMLKADENEILIEMNKKLEIIVKEGDELMVAGYAQAIADVQAIFQDRYVMLNGMRE